MFYSVIAPLERLFALSRTQSINPASEGLEDERSVAREQEKAKKLLDLGVKAVVGSFKTDLDLLEKLSEGSHAVFNCVCYFILDPVVR